MSIDQYEFIEVPGARDIRIPLVKRTTGLEKDTTGVIVPDWVVYIDGSNATSTLDGYEDWVELGGWLCESSRHVQGYPINQLRPAVSWHSPVYLVLPNGPQNPHINNCIAKGICTQRIVIRRITRIGDATVTVIQELTFQTCHWCIICAYLDWSIAGFTACVRTNTVIGFTQRGVACGQTSCTINYVDNTIDV
jgi:hypothetical protein